jgi:hypothetical protein
LSTAAIVHGLSTDHDRRRGQRRTFLPHPRITYPSGYICSNKPSHF